MTSTLSSGETVGYRYDDVGNRTRLIYPHQGKEVQYEYNEANQLVKVVDWDQQETAYQYDNLGRPITITLPNSVTTSLTYDAAGNLLNLTHTSITGTIGSYVYQYDNTGRRIGAIETGRVITYTYDALYRLTDAVESAGDVYHYDYDAAGNRLLKIEPGVNQSAAYDVANQLVTLGGMSVTHDANGNLVHDGVFTYTYNSLDQLVAVSNGITGTLYGYNGDGDRLWQNTDGISTTFILDLNSALAQVIAQTPHTVNGATTYFVPGASAQQTQGVWSYLHTDGLGSIRHLTDPTGQVLGNMRYSPFGEVVAMSGPAAMFGFTGEQQNSTNDLTYLRARYYNPSLGRFLTQDSLIPDITNGQALNAYTYVYNDPINLVDPGGNVPGLPIQGLDMPTRDDARAVLRTPFEWGLNFLNWWNRTPENCYCQGTSSTLIGGLAVGPQAAWAYASEPAERYGVKITEQLIDIGLLTKNLT